jgi:hypothetical protein
MKTSRIELHALYRPGALSGSNLLWNLEIHGSGSSVEEWPSVILDSELDQCLAVIANDDAV